MIPLRDTSRTPVRFPVVTVSLIAVATLEFAAGNLGGPAEERRDDELQQSHADQACSEIRD